MYVCRMLYECAAWQLVTRFGVCDAAPWLCVSEYLCATSAGICISSAGSTASKVAFQFQLFAKAPAYQCSSSPRCSSS